MQYGHDPFDPRLSGYRLLYRMGGHNPCPGCSRSHWQVGRMTAECAFCATALPIAGRGDDSWQMRAA